MGENLEFRPPPVRRGVHLALAVVMLAGAVAAGAVLLPLLLAGTRITYAIAGGVLRVETGSWAVGGKRSFALRDVTEVRTVPLSGRRKRYGVDAPGLCVGEFTYEGLGEVWQATSCSDSGVLLTIRGADHPLLVSPSDPARFVRAIREGTPSIFSSGPAPGSPAWSVLAAGALLVPSILLFLAALFAFAPSRLRYRVGHGELEVRTWLVRRHFPLAGAVARRHDARAGIRLAGTAVPGYFTGWFLVDGHRCRVYATRFGGGVLVEGPSRVFVSPAEVEPFLAAMVEAGASQG